MRLSMIILGGLAFTLCIVGVTLLFLTDRGADDYPYGEVIVTVGNCGKTFYKQPASSVRIERYRCYVTEDSAGEVHTWYIRQGYEPRSGGFVREEVSSLGRRYYDIERIYTYQEDGKTVIRVYDDTIVRFR